MAQGRHAWVDNLRTAMIVLVVNMHACVTCSHVGGWYRKEGVEPLLAAKWPFLLWQGHRYWNYIAAFIAGVRAGRHGWLEPLAGSTTAARAGWIGVLGGPALMMAVLALLGPPGGPDPYEGGLNRRAFALALWEQSAGLCLGLGALALFRRHGGWDGPWSRWLSDHAFAVYVSHAPVMVVLTPWLRSLDAGLVGRTLALTGLTLVSTYAAAAVASRIPGLRTIL